MFESFTPGALRALERARVRARGRGAARVEPADLLAALVDEPESRAAVLLAEHGLGPARVLGALDVAEVPPEGPAAAEAEAGAVAESDEYRAILGEATARARAVGRNRPVGTEHLLAGVLGGAARMAERLVEAGLRLEALIGGMEEAVAEEAGPIALEEGALALDLGEPGEAMDLGRLLDASANRAGEGLRVVEDYLRFVLDDPGLTRRVKDIRHRLGQAVRGLDPELRLASRDTAGDVGTHIMTVSEQVRENPRAVLAANFRRTAEALRSLEEYSKLADVWLAGRFEVLRYDVYTLEKLTMAALVARKAMGEVALYVLVGGLPTPGDLRWVVGEALAGGAQAIQLREKGLPDRELLARAREVRLQTARAGARFLLNDRPDLARLCGADGVHLGQEDLSVRDARRVVGPAMQVGVSTHDRGQIEAALLAGANHLGVGPVFPSATKDFPEYVGLALVRQAAEATDLPWFAIGGVTESNIEAVLDAGASRVAVSSAVVRAASPRRAAAALRARLDERG